MNEYRRYSCLKGLFMCKRVTKMVEFGLILLVMCVCSCSDSNVSANQLCNLSCGATVTQLTSRKIKKSTILAERHDEFRKAESSRQDEEFMYDQDNPDYVIHWTGIIKSQAIGIKTNRFQRIYYYPYRVWQRSIIRC